MGLEIGFRLFDKNKFIESKDLVEIEPKASETSYVCGRSPAAEAWSHMIDISAEKTIVPVFQKELDGFVRKSGYSDYDITEYKCIAFDDFKKGIIDAIDSVRSDSQRECDRQLKRIGECKDEIKELREWQLKCGEDNAYAFDRWESRIAELKEDIECCLEYISDPADHDYDYAATKSIEKLIDGMQARVRDGDALVIPYASY